MAQYESAPLPIQPAQTFNVPPNEEYGTGSATLPTTERVVGTPGPLVERYTDSAIEVVPSHYNDLDGPTTETSHGHELV